ncbi:MAG: aminotransferase class I/II-fold pyridoxal phosphate-dependent enzyme [Eubacterium sp.]|nr:aminotransferase class I/II-fold pyridoxal phosphate-dependent enzyme [Eubacterium sp.]
MNLNDKLNNLCSYPFHMPGHKRNKKFGITGSEIDITEIYDFDNLHDAGGVLLDIENRLANVYKSKKAFMLVNGSTVGILSAVFALCDEGDKVIVARNCHKSVYNACMLRKLRVIYIEPEFDGENGFYKSLSQETIDEAIKNNPDAKALVITSPTYEGYVSEINSSLPLIIDAAHGAHFGIGKFPKYPKGDIVVSSLHKTLPALTQTAVLNVFNKEYENRVKLFLDIFETSSPSYVLMSSVEKCLDYIEGSESDFDDYYDRLSSLHSQSLEKLKIRKTDDKSKIIVSTASSTLSGKRLAEMLREDFNIEVEAYSKNYVILMSSVADDEEALRKLAIALLTIDDANSEVEKAEAIPFKKPPCPAAVQTISIVKSVEQTEFKNSDDKVANEFVFAYPPDIPLIVPNETITREILDYICEIAESGVNIISDSSLFPDKILTKAE